MVVLFPPRDFHESELLKMEFDLGHDGGLKNSEAGASRAALLWENGVGSVGGG